MLVLPKFSDILLHDLQTFLYNSDFFFFFNFQELGEMFSGLAARALPEYWLSLGGGVAGAPLASPPMSYACDFFTLYFIAPGFI